MNGVSSAAFSITRSSDGRKVCVHKDGVTLFFRWPVWQDFVSALDDGRLPASSGSWRQTA
jgi:hypothetical protein